MKTLPLIIMLTIFNPIFAKPHMIAELGDLSCIEKSTNVKKQLSEVNIKTTGASRSEKKLLANVTETIEKLTNQQQAETILGGLTVNFKDVLRSHSSGGCLPAHQLVPKQISIGRKCANGYEIKLQEGIVIHEIGHFVANKLGLYSKYTNQVSRRCRLTSYMRFTRTGRKHKNRNEEFAEVFAAYLIYGKKLKRSCKKSYEFMRKNLFLGTESLCR